MDLQRQNWYSFEEAVNLLCLSPRAGRDWSRRVASSLVRSERLGAGRPRLLYHYLAHPRLTAHHESATPPLPPSATPPLCHSSTPPLPPSATPPLPPRALALGVLRLRAVRYYWAACNAVRESLAAAATVQEFRRRPISTETAVDDRLPGNHKRRHSGHVALYPFSMSALRNWSRIAKADPSPAALAPRKAGRSGRAPRIVPDDLLSLVWSLSGSTARANVARAVALARRQWPGEFPQISLRTWQRRVLAIDPRRAIADLSHSVGRYRARHNPDCEVDWNALPYNSRWEIDDAQKDWYAYAPERDRLLRPYAYRVLRSATRQWLALVTSACPIVQEQIRVLIAVAMHSPQGGIPDEIRFEHGATATDPHLTWLLETLGVRVSLISMDNGAVHAGAFADPSRGHPQGHALIEANTRREHGLEWAMPAQVGPEERRTAPPRLENLKAAAERLAKAGQFLTLPQADEWHRIALETCERSNNTPHTGLPKIVDPATGETRHMTPNERGQQLSQNVEIRTLDERLLPLFYARGVRVPVTRNGFRLGNLSYGRFDEDLRAHAHVTAYADPDNPRAAFVWELGRCVELYVPAAPGDHSQLQRQKHLEKQARSEYRRATLAAAELLGQGRLLIDQTAVTADPVAGRPTRDWSHPLLAERAIALTAAVAHSNAQETEFQGRFRPLSTDPETPEKRPQNPRRRTSLLRAADRLAWVPSHSRNNPQEEVAHADRNAAGVPIG